MKVVQFSSFKNGSFNFLMILLIQSLLLSKFSLTFFFSSLSFSHLWFSFDCIRCVTPHSAMGLLWRTACFLVPTFTTHPLCFISFPKPVASPWNGPPFWHFRGRPLWGGRSYHSRQPRSPLHRRGVRAGALWAWLGSPGSPFWARPPPCPCSKGGRPHGSWVWVLLPLLQMLSASLPLAARWRRVPGLPQPPQGLGLPPARGRPALRLVLPLAHPPLRAPALRFSVGALLPDPFPPSGALPLLSGGESCRPDGPLWLWLEWQGRGRGSTYGLSPIGFRSVRARMLHFPLRLPGAECKHVHKSQHGLPSKSMIAHFHTHT